jgi:hypothetical protein
MVRITRLCVEDEKWKFVQGERFADILGLPVPWPPEEPANLEEKT